MPSVAENDAFGRIEVRGIDVIPATERHGEAHELFALWLAPNITYLYIVLGGALLGLGLDAREAIGVVFAGNVFWLLVGVLSISGPASGTPSGIVMRAMFGVRGNRANVAIVGWATSVAYEAINVSVGALAAFALLDLVRLPDGAPMKLAVVVVLAAVTLTISVYGHATIVRLSTYFTLALAVCVAVLACYVVPHANMRAAGPAPAHHTSALVAALIGITVIASGPLSWNTAADYSRYLPATTSHRAIAWWVALGGFLPSVALGTLGVLAGTAIDMTNPQASFATILPAWFYPVFLLVIVAGSITNNVLTAYSSGLALQAMGVTWTRALTVVFDGVAGVALALYALFSPDFNAALENILTLSVSLLGPSLAIYAVDIALRRNVYDGPSLHDESPQSPFWYRHGYNWAGITALTAGTAVALLCVNTSAMRGPVSNALGGADLSSLAGPLVAAAVYAGMTVRARRTA